MDDATRQRQTDRLVEVMERELRDVVGGAPAVDLQVAYDPEAGSPTPYDSGVIRITASIGGDAQTVPVVEPQLECGDLDTLGRVLALYVGGTWKGRGCRAAE